MKRQLIWMTASVAALGAGLAGAQTYSTRPAYGYGDNYGQTVRCESTDSRLRRCRINAAGEVRIVRQLSREQCIQGRNWTYSRDEIRVSNGCRADFQVLPRDDRYGYDDRGRYGNGNGYGYGRDQVVRCDSRSMGRTYCGDATSRYTMVGYRNGNCIADRTYGQDSRGLWVAGSCSAQFRRLHDDDRNDRNDRYAYGNGQSAYPQTLRCASNSSGRTYCGDANARYTLRDTSSRNCIEGRTWGTDDRGLWVSNACNAVFTRDYYGRDDDRYSNGSYDEQPYYEREDQQN
jgi:hypothetical protein